MLSSRAVEGRLLGRTGLLVPRLGLGFGAVAGLMVRGDRRDQAQTVAQALEAGIRLFDTAPSYGDGISEENLGRALAAMDTAQSALVGTKVRLSNDDLGDVRSAIRRSLEGSCRRLGRERVDLLQLHNLSGEGLDDDQLLGDIAAAMRETVDDGLVGHIGFMGLGHTAAIHRALGAGVFETVQAYFNVANPSAVYPGATGGGQDFDGLVTVAAEHDVGVINARVYAAGALNATQGRHPIAGPVGGPFNPEDLDGDLRLSALAGELGMESAHELELRFALGAPGISVVLVGLSSLEHLEAALRWEARGPLPTEVIERVAGFARPEASAGL